MSLRRQLKSVVGDARRSLLTSLYRRSVNLGDNGPIVSFTFDDFPRNALTAGGAILERHGVRGTYYTAMGLMNSTTECGEQFHRGDLDDLLEQGHELASHTFSHISSRKASREAFAKDVMKGIATIEETCGVAAINFAYPFGDVSFASKKFLQEDLAGSLGSARGIIPGLNGAEIDLSLLRANGLYGDVHQLPRAEQLITENVAKKSWLIFYTHDVCPQPSKYGCTPELLEAVVAAAIRSGSRVITGRETFAALGIVPESPKVQSRNCASV